MRRLYFLVAMLLFLLAIPVGLWFLLYDNPYPFDRLKRMWGFWSSWASSTGCTFVAMVGVAYLTVQLHRRWPWDKPWATRLALQLGLGVALPLALVLAWNAVFFVERNAVFQLQAYYDAEFRLAAILLVVFNGICAAVLEIWRRLPGRMVGGGDAVGAEGQEMGNDGREETLPPIDIAYLTANCAYIEVSGRTCVVYRLDGGKELYTITLDAMERLLRGPHFCRIFRNHIVNRKAIRDWEFIARKRKCRVLLHEPYQDVALVVGQHYQKQFLAWIGEP